MKLLNTSLNFVFIVLCIYVGVKNKFSNKMNVKNCLFINILTAIEITIFEMFEPFLRLDKLI